MHHLRRSRVVPARSVTRSGTRGLTAVILAVLTRTISRLLSQVGNNPLPVTPRREEAGRTRGRGRHPKGDRRGPRGRGRKESRSSSAELWRPEKEADLVRLVDNCGVIRVALGPKRIRRADVGLVPRSHMVNDTPRPLRPVLPMAPRAGTDTGTVDKGSPPHVLVVILHPGGITRTHTAHRVEGLIEASRLEASVADKNKTIGGMVDVRKPTGRPEGTHRGARAPPARRGPKAAPRRGARASQRETPIRTRPHGAQAEHPTGAPVSTSSFQNFKPQNFKLSVSDPKKKYVADVPVLSNLKIPRV